MPTIIPSSAPTVKKLKRKNLSLIQKVHTFLLELNTPVQRQISGINGRMMDPNNFSRLLRYFSEGRLGSMTIEELLSKRPQEIMEMQKGLGEHSVKHLQFLITQFGPQEVITRRKKIISRPISPIRKSKFVNKF